MAQAKASLITQDQCIVAASRAFCAEWNALVLLGEQQDEDLPGSLVDPMFDRMERARRRAMMRQARTMEGVLAKARMVEAGAFFDVDPLSASTIRDLLAVATAALPHPAAPAIEKTIRKAAYFKAASG